MSTVHLHIGNLKIFYSRTKPVCNLMVFYFVHLTRDTMSTVLPSTVHRLDQNPGPYVGRLVQLLSDTVEDPGTPGVVVLLTWPELGYLS